MNVDISKRRVETLLQWSNLASNIFIAGCISNMFWKINEDDSIIEIINRTSESINNVFVAFDNSSASCLKICRNNRSLKVLFIDLKISIVFHPSITAFILPSLFEMRFPALCLKRIFSSLKGVTRLR
jgi:hypothetical protein